MYLWYLFFSKKIKYLHTIFCNSCHFKIMHINYFLCVFNDCRSIGSKEFFLFSKTDKKGASISCRYHLFSCIFQHAERICSSKQLYCLLHCLFQVSLKMPGNEVHQYF